MSNFLNRNADRVLPNIIVVFVLFIASDVRATVRPNILLILADDK